MAFKPGEKAVEKNSHYEVARTPSSDSSLAATVLESSPELTPPIGPVAIADMSVFELFQ